MLYWSRNGACSNSRYSRQRRRLSLTRLQGGSIAALLAASAVTYAQDTPAGMLARFDVQQRLEYSDNADLDADGDSDFFGRTVLNFGLESVTSVQRFALNLSTDIEEFQDDNSSDFDFTNSFANLNYTRQNRNALFGLELRYRESDVDSDFFSGDFDQDSNVITQSSGTRESFGYTLRGAVGQDAPVGANFSWRFNEINYQGTTDPGLRDSTLNDFSGQVDFRVSPKITTNLTAGYTDFEPEGGGVARETTRLGAGAVLQISRTLSADVGLSYDSIDRSGDEVDSDEGISLFAGLQREMPNGTWGLNFSSDISSNDNGRRSVLSVSRSMALPRGTLDLEFGLTGADTIGTDPLLQASYRHDLPDGQLSFGLTQRVTTDDNNNEDINTTLRAGYDQQINSLSSFGVNLSFFNSNDLGENSSDSQRVEFGVTYRRSVTRDWGLVSGFSRTMLSDDNQADRNRNTLFVGLERSFSWNP